VPTIIDSLIVELNLESKGFEQGTADASKSLADLRNESAQTADSANNLSQSVQNSQNQLNDNSHRTARSMQEHGAGASQFFSKIRNEAIMMLGVFTAGQGLASFAKNTVNAAASTGILSQQIGVNVNQLNAMEAAAQRAGGAEGAMTAQLKAEADKRAKINVQGSNIREVYGETFTRFGGDFRKMTDPENQIKEYAKIYQNIKKSLTDKGMDEKQATASAAMTVKEAGAQEGILPFIMQDQTTMQGQIEAQKQKVAMTQADTEAAIKANHAWFDLDQQMTKVGTRVVNSLTPAFETLTKKLGEINLPNAEQIDSTLKSWTITAENGIKNADKYAKAVSGGSTAWELLSKANEKAMKFIMPNTDAIINLFQKVKLPSPEEVESTVKRWDKSLHTFMVDTVDPAINSSQQFGDIISKNWKNGFSSLFELNLTGWTDKLSAMINKVKELTQELTDFASRNVIEPAAGLVDKAKDALGLGDDKPENEPNGDVKTNATQRQMMSNVYEGFKKAGLDDKQAKVMTAQVGRENDFQAKTIFGYHNDPARGVNVGMMSWQGDRGAALEEELKAKGLMKGGKIEQSQATIDAQTAFAVAEMKGKYRGKLGTFFDKKDASWQEMSKETGKNYVGWAYDQDTIRKSDGSRVPFDWQAHHAREAGYYNKLGEVVGSQATQEQKALAPAAIIIPKGDKDINGKPVELSPLMQAQQAARVQPPEPIKENKNTEPPLPIKKDSQPIESPLPVPVITALSALGKKDKQGENEYIEVEDPMFPNNPKVKENNPKFNLAERTGFTPEMPKSAMVSQGMVGSTNTQSNVITINVKSTDPKGAANEIKTTLNERLTSNFVSGMRS